MANLYNGLRLIDLIDTDTQGVNDLYDVVKINLTSLKDTVYPVNDNTLFDDFIERLCDRYFNRFLSFDSYYLFFLKLKFVLEDNKIKYNKIYEASLKKVDPLITFEENERVKEDRKNEGSSGNESSVENRSNSDYHNSSLSNSHTDTSQESKSNSNTTNTQTDDTHSNFQNTTDEQKTLQAHSSNPKSNTSISMDPSAMTYIDAENLTVVKDNYHNVTDNTGTTTSSNVNSSNGNNTGTSTTDSNTTGNGDSSSQSKTDSSSTGTYSDLVNSAIERIKSGFNGNQIELLKLYTDYYFDMNKEIINDIERAHLFMSTLC